MEEKRKKTRVRRKNGGIKKLLLILILLFIIIQLLIKVILPGSVSLARYVYKAVRSYYLTSMEFYFNSDKLSTNVAHFESDNWSGVDEYRVGVNMNSRKNINEVSKVDIDYNIDYEYTVYRSDGTPYEDEKITFYITGSENVDEGATLSRTIFKERNQDSFEFAVKPLLNANLQNNDYVFVKITATSTSPFVSELVGEFKITIGTLGMSYKIEDEAYSPYCEVIVTNTLDYYIADETIGSIQAGSSFTIQEYLALTDEEKEKCHSMLVTLEFEPETLRLDTTSGVYLVADKTNDVTYETITKNGESYEYVNKIQFKMEAEESKVIKFYKVNASENYTYPLGEGSVPIVAVTTS